MPITSTSSVLVEASDPAEFRPEDWLNKHGHRRCHGLQTDRFEPSEVGDGEDGGPTARYRLFHLGRCDVDIGRKSAGPLALTLEDA